MSTDRPSGSSGNAREFTRVPLQILVRVVGESGACEEGVARDLSLRGVYLSGADTLVVGERCEVELELGGGEVTVRAYGRVARVERAGIAIEFTELPLDALDHLRKLVLYNAEDPDEVEREFRSHSGLRSKASDD